MKEAISLKLEKIHVEEKLLYMEGV